MALEGMAMISRQWRGLAKTTQAEDYVAHLRTDTFPKLRRIAGFVDATILRREVEQGVEFLIVTRWESFDSIRAFAGADAETAVVPDNVQRMMVEFDDRVRHYDIVE
jgi:heme-degrading monooxygenase HmoA